MEFDLERLGRDWIEGISGQELRARVRNRSAELEGVPRPVVIEHKDPISFAVEFFAAVASGQTIALANPSWGRRERDEFDALLTQVGVPPLGGRIHHTDRLKAGLQPSTILIPTGGTTGGVKLAIHTWASLEAACAGVQEFLGGGPIDSCCVLPLYHVSGLMQLLRAYHSGGYIRFDEDEVAGCCLSYVPTQLHRALSNPKRIQNITTARAIFVGGAPMSEALAAKVRALKLPIVPVYGMTETAAMVAAIPAEDFLANPNAGAHPIGDARIEMDPSGRIRIHSPALFKGYHARTPMDLSNGYLTDDEGRLDDQGRLHVIGRVDRLIISGGEKIDPVEVELAVMQLGGVQEVLVVGMPDAEWGQKLVVYFTGQEVVDWKARLQGRLVNYKLPKQMIHVDRLPLDEKGNYVGASLVKTAEAETHAASVFINEAPMEKTLPVRKTPNLRKGRTSIPGARYFITICTKNRQSSLLGSPIAQSILATWRLQHGNGDFTFHCGTVMPDHIHFLFTLAERVTLGQCLIKFKAKTKAALAAADLSWQRDFYDHRLRADDAMESFTKYIFLNPYRKSLLRIGESWAHWHLSRDYRPEFIQHLDAKGAPPQEWLAEPEAIETLIECDLHS